MKMVDYKIYAFNVRGIRDKVKRRCIFRHLKKKYPGGIYLLQETHGSDDIEQIWKNEWNGPLYFSHGETDSCGVTTLVSPDIDLNVIETIKDEGGRFLALKIRNHNADDYLLCNVYAPTRNRVKEQIEFLNYVKDTFCLLNPLNIIMGGDFNTIFNPILDKQGGNAENCTNLYTEELVAFSETYDLIDAIRFQHPDEKIFTRIQRSPPILTRIDHWLISSQLANYLQSTNAHPGIKSDHSIISLHLCSSHTQHGRGFWKFNSTLLRDIDYVKSISEKISMLKENTVDMDNKCLRWDYIKTELRGYTLQYSSRKNKEKKEFKLKIERDLYEIQAQLNNNASMVNMEKYYFLKEELEKIEEIETRGAILRSKVKWSEAGEKNSKYFLNLEKKNAADKHIYQLQLPNGEITSDPKLILNEQKRYYQNLYSDSGPLNIQDQNRIVHRFTDNLNTLSDDEVQVCEGLITEQECADALKEMTNGKSPGCDGFTVDFYKVFWKNLKLLLVESLNYSYKKGELSVDQKRGIITLIPKKNKIRLLLKNWRPIFLLNTDYKILTKSLARRLHKVLPLIIDLDQTGFTKGRYIGENIRTIVDLIDYTSLRNKPGIILLLDFEKAFDTIKWSFIFQSLQLFNFGPEFIQWIKTIYYNSESTVINYGNTAGFFKLQKGIRQGCPISPYLFIIAVEVMANGIRENCNVKGIKVGDTEFKISQLADDTTVFVSTFESIKTVLQLIEDFGRISGLKLNIEKTIAKCVGSLKGYHGHVSQNTHNLNWIEGPLQTLGITITNNPQIILKEVFMPRLKVFDNILNMWHSRGLSLKGKITILKSLALPQLQYPMSVLPVPDVVVELVDNMITDFLWSKRKPKIKRNVVIQSIENGGLKAPHFAAMVEANRISWIKRLLCESKMRWKCIFSEFIKPFSLTHFTETYLEDDHILSIQMPFYKQLYQIWNKVRSKPEKLSEYLAQVIWKNKFIQLPVQPKSKRCKTLCWPALYEAGIVRVIDLFKPDGTFINLHEFCKDHNIKCNFLQVIQIKKAIPKTWVTMITSQLTHSTENTNVNLLLKTSGKCYDICKSSTKTVYEHIILSKYVQATAVQRWSEQFEIDEDDWSNIFTLPFKTSRETKLQSFQYKIIHRVISCRKWLYNQKVIPSPYCTLCNNNCIDTILHLLIECSSLNSFWKHIESWWNRVSQTQVQLTKKHIIFGIYYDLNYFSTINYVVLLAKWYIYTNIYLKHKTELYGFLVLLKHRLEIEKQISYSNGKKDEFNKKWLDIIDKL